MPRALPEIHIGNIQVTRFFFTHMYFYKFPIAYPCKICYHIGDYFLDAHIGMLADAIMPVLSCPPSQTVLLHDEQEHVTLDGAEVVDNTGVKTLLYQPMLTDSSAIFKKPDRLVISRHSVGHSYSILVTAEDYNHNQATCNYTLTVEGMIFCNFFVFL